MDSRAVKIENELVEAIARRVVDLLRSEGLPDRSPRYVDAAVLAYELSVERDWIYAHAEELGAIRLGGPNGRLRFDLEKVRADGRERKIPSAARVKSPEKRRQASGRTPATSPKRQHTGR